MTNSEIMWKIRGAVGWSQVPWNDLTLPEQVLRVIWQLEGDVNNGGFDQYYFNPWSEFAFAAVDAFKAVGADRTADIVARANAVFPCDHPPRNRALRIKLQNALPEAAFATLDALDKEFYAQPDDLPQLLLAYVLRHAKEVRGAQYLVA